MVSSRPSRFKSDIRIKPEKPRKKVEPTVRLCEAEGCIGLGECRVPRSRNNLSEYYWYCTAHARAHNESWDYFKGMDDDAIMRFRDEALLGHRPTWPLGKRAAKARTGQRLFQEGAFEVDDRHALLQRTRRTPPPAAPNAN